MGVHITGHRAGFAPGITRVTGLDDETGIEFGVLRLSAGAAEEMRTTHETALLLMSGSATLTLGNRTTEIARA